MIQGIESFPAKLHAPLFSELEGLRQAHVKVVYAAGVERVATYRESIGQSDSLNPVNVSRTDTQTGIWISIARCAELRPGRRRDDGAAIRNMWLQVKFVF